jgi:hypothetical protein
MKTPHDCLKLSVVIPVYNERNTIEEILDRVARVNRSYARNLKLLETEAGAISESSFMRQTAGRERPFGGALVRRVVRS